MRRSPDRGAYAVEGLQSLAVAFVGALLAVGFAARWVSMQSGDFALHYDLARYLALHGLWPGRDATLPSGMGPYPPLAHYMAVLAGLPYRSTMMGLNAVALLSVFTCYFMLVRTLVQQSTLASAVALAIAGAGVLVARTQHAAEGFQIYLNFFYAQMVGDAVLLLFVYGLCAWPRGWPSRLAISALATFAAGWLYSITSVEIALAVIAFEAVLLIRRIRDARSFRIGWALPATTAAVLLPALVVLNPTFRLMVAIAKNDGVLPAGLFDHWIPGLAALLLITGLVLGLAVPDGPRWRRTGLFLACVSCAVAVAALVQAVGLAVFHAGSDYAVKKYMFSVVTVLVFDLGLIAAIAIDRSASRFRSPAFAILVPTLLAAAATILMPNVPAERLDRFLSYQKKVALMAAHGQLPADGAGTTASRNRAYSWGLNYAVDIGDLGMPVATAVKALEQFVGTANEPDSARYEFIDDPKNTVPGECVRDRSVPGVVLVSVACMANHLPSIDRDASLDMASLSSRPDYFGFGWSGKEPGGTWSDASSAELAMHVDPGAPEVRLSLRGAGFLPTPTYVQHVKLSVAGRALAVWTFDAASPAGQRSVVIPGALISNGDIRLHLDFPESTTPYAHHLSGDQRQLGMFVQGLKVTVPLGPGDVVDLSQRPILPSYFQSGWAGKEPAGVWTGATTTRLAIPVADTGGPVSLTIDGAGFLPTPAYVQHVSVSSNGTPLARWTFDAKSPQGLHTFTVPRFLVKDGLIVLDISTPDATSPAHYNLSGDVRHLAMFVRSISRPMKASLQSRRG